MDQLTHIKGSKEYHLFKDGFYFPMAFVFVGGVFIMVGVILLIQLNIYCIIFLTLGVFPIFSKKGIEIDLHLKMYREPFIFFNTKLGNWEDLPDLAYISIFGAVKGQNMTFVAVQGSVRYSEMEVNLIYNKNRRLNIFLTEDYNKALEVAKLFSRELRLEILDASTKEKQWLPIEN